MIKNLYKDIINHENLERDKMLNFVIELIESKGDMMEFHLETTMIWIRYTKGYNDWFSISFKDDSTSFCIKGRNGKANKYTLLDDEKLYGLLKDNIIRTKQPRMYINNDDNIREMQDMAGLKRKRIIAELLKST